jgi:glycosyltransferase involved in cell wall biosynthesis
MKVAIIHDYLNQYGGAERVLEALLKIFPEADIYTLFYSATRTLGRFDAHVRRTSFLDVPFVRKRHRPFIPLMPLAAQTLSLRGAYDLVVSATAGYAKGIRVRATGHPPFHLSYCYTPLRYAWEYRDYFRNPVFASVLAPAFSYLRAWDLRAAQNPDAMLAVSGYIADKIRACYGREADVVHPPVDTKLFFPGKAADAVGDYYLAAGRLMHYKRFDLVLQAFRHTGLPLKVVGVGPEARALRRMADALPNVQFLSFVPDAEMRRLYQGARAFIFPHVEDFGLVALEAHACGTPVVAFRSGGVTEIVKDGKTGVFFSEQSTRGLIEAVQRAGKMHWNRAHIARHAQKFSFASFKQGILSHIPPEVRKR